ncbi:carbonic anhydrase 13-like [Wyeomyia smithii]|uniref:carbonic anhydrase 13-like n=1 Tax=Wyeomyia smithii TaxID=174621 RepID=UPI002468129E|nr:carbonic anhydrase 13-like [Wyeomyia smithii]
MNLIICRWLLIMFATEATLANNNSRTRSFAWYNREYNFANKTQQQHYNYYESARNLRAAPNIFTTKDMFHHDSSHSDVQSFSYLEEHEFGPSNWGVLNANCNGLYQSPVNLALNRSRIIYKKRPLQLMGLENQPKSLTVLNEGGSAAYFLEFRKENRPRLRGGPLPVDYLFYQFHYHVGSEHSLEGKLSAAEVHLVFYNSLYETFEDARDQIEGLAVIALIYDVLAKDRIQTLNKWTRFLDSVVDEGREYRAPAARVFTLQDVIPNTKWPYFSYEGSLTTPPCTETVRWLVATERMPLTKSELKKMRQLKGRGAEWVKNSRPTQALNYRRVLLY